MKPATHRKSQRITSSVTPKGISKRMPDNKRRRTLLFSLAHIELLREFISLSSPFVFKLDIH
jgi:hypothetical protein